MLKSRKPLPIELGFFIGYGSWFRGEKNKSIYTILFSKTSVHIFRKYNEFDVSGKLYENLISYELFSDKYEN